MQGTGTGACRLRCAACAIQPSHAWQRPLPTLLSSFARLQAVLGTLGVRAEYTTTNHIMEVQQFLGIGE